MRKNRKGFTRLELIVVMVVLVIVLTTSAITYINLIKKARLSADALFVKSANTVLTTSKDKVTSLDDALNLVFDNGYNEYSLFAKNDTNHFAFDTENNKFLLLNDDGKVVYAESKTNPKNYQIIVVYENDLRIKGNAGMMYFYRDIEVEGENSINGNYDINLNGKTLSGNTITISGENSVEAVVKNGKINAGELKIVKKGVYAFSANTNIEVENFVSSSDIVLYDNAIVNVKSSFLLNTGVVFTASGEHTLTLPAKIEIGKNVKASNSKNVTPVVMPDSDTFMLNMSTNLDTMTIDSLDDFVYISQLETYTIDSGYYIIGNDITFDKPLTIMPGKSVAINMVGYTLKFTGKDAVIVEGDLRVKGTSNTATLRGGSKTISNKGELVVDNVSILAGNDNQNSSFDAYIANGTSTQTVGILNTTGTTTMAKVTIVKAIIKAKIAIRNIEGELSIIEADVTGSQYAIKSEEGNIGIGNVVGGMRIVLTGDCFFNEDTVVIGIAGSDNFNISMGEIKGDKTGVTDHRA